MFETIIFSHSNPQMLSLTIQSLRKHLPGDVRLNVFYTCESVCTEGYDWLKTISGDMDIRWHYYHKNLKECLVEFLKIDATSKEILFLTDSDVLFDSIDFETIEKCMLQDDVLCHSLKLGKNTTFCSRMNINNVIKAEEFDDFIKWDWTKHYLDFGYPFSLNSHIFNTKDIIKLIQKVPFNNHLELEEGLQIFEYFPKQYMTAFKESKSVIVPYNQDYITYENFDEGYVPDYETMDFSNINQCEKEIYFENKKIIK